MNAWPVLATPMTVQQAMQLDPLVLAYVGDSVQALYVRTYLAASTGQRAGKLHDMSIQCVSAVAQAGEVDVIRAMFTPEEDDVYRAARNHKSKSTAKNASVADYRKASGLEAVWGYLYLTGQEARLGVLLRAAHKFEE